MLRVDGTRPARSRVALETLRRVFSVTVQHVRGCVRGGIGRMSQDELGPWFVLIPVGSALSVPFNRCVRFFVRIAMSGRLRGRR